MSHASPKHRALNHQLAEALARDGDDNAPGIGAPALVTSRHRLKDMKSMIPTKLKLAELWQRESAKGTIYYSGFMGGVRLVMLDAGEQPHPSRTGKVVRVWRLFAEEQPPPRRSPPTRD